MKVKKQCDTFTATSTSAAWSVNCVIVDLAENKRRHLCKHPKIAVTGYFFQEHNSYVATWSGQLRELWRRIFNSFRYVNSQNSLRGATKHLYNVTSLPRGAKMVIINRIDILKYINLDILKYINLIMIERGVTLR